jgi:hypothetical protein
MSPLDRASTERARHAVPLQLRHVDASSVKGLRPICEKIRLDPLNLQ